MFLLFYFILYCILPVELTYAHHSLTSSLSALGARCVMEVLQQWPSCTKMSVSQDASCVSKAPKLRAELGRLSWQPCSNVTSMSSESIMRKWRAFDNSIGVHAYFVSRSGQPARRVKMLKIRNPASESLPSSLLSTPSVQSGGLVFDSVSRALFLRTDDGWIELEQLQVETKPRPVSGADFARGSYISPTSGHKFE